VVLEPTDGQPGNKPIPRTGVNQVPNPDAIPERTMTPTADPRILLKSSHPGPERSAMVPFSHRVQAGYSGV